MRKEKIRDAIHDIFIAVIVGLVVGVFLNSVISTFKLNDIEKNYGSAIFNAENRLTLLEEKTDAIAREITRPIEISSQDVSFDRETISRVVMAEARGESLAGCMAVCQVIKDRGDLWNMDYTDVVLSPNQFAKPYEGEISEKVETAVTLVFELGYRVTKEHTTHFYAHELIPEPYWAKDKTMVLELDGHRFYE